MSDTSDQAMWADTFAAFDAIGELRSAIAASQAPQTVMVPDVGVDSATESLATVAALIGSFPGYVAGELTMLANAEHLGVMDVFRADNPCINWGSSEDS